MADLTWSWWAPRQRHFDAAVNVCALGFERPAHGRHRPGGDVWTGVVTDRLGIPELDRNRLACAGTLGERAELNANFRDEYYALVPAVHEGGDGPPLVTSGLIDPGICLWGRRAMTFAAPDVHSPPRRPHAVDRPLPAVGGAQTRPEGARRQPDPNHRGGRRPAWRVAAGRSRQHRDTRRPAHVASTRSQRC